MVDKNLHYLFPCSRLLAKILKHGDVVLKSGQEFVVGHDRYILDALRE